MIDRGLENWTTQDLEAAGASIEAELIQCKDPAQKARYELLREVREELGERLGEKLEFAATAAAEASRDVRTAAAKIQSVLDNVPASFREKEGGS